jgi:hypothetical protein
MKPLTYPLEQLMTIKQNRFDQAVKTLEAKKLLLEQAKQKLAAAEKERNDVLGHKTAKLAQLRESLDAGTTTDKIQQMKVYLKLVDERLVEKEKRVVEAQKGVDVAQKQVEAATQEVFQKKKDLEKLEMHKEEWEKEMRYWTEKQAGAEQDEQGSATHTMRKRESDKRGKSAE